MTNLVGEKPENWKAGVESFDDGLPSPFALGTTLLRNRWRIFRWIVIGGAIAVLPVLFKKVSYTSTASFVPEGSQDPAASGLAGIAGRFGIQLGAATQGQSPQFYAQLLGSRAILAPVVTDTFTVDETNGRPRVLLDILGVKGDTPAKRAAKGVTELRRLTGMSISDRTGIVTISATTEWPSLSHGITQRLLTRLNDFNLHTRQRQAGEERRFTEERLKEARAALSQVEDRLLNFVQRNRSFQNSPELSVQYDHLQRDVQLQQTVVSALAQSYEEVRMREVRDTPVITVIEESSTPTEPNARGRVKRGLLGMFLGGLFGVFLILVRDAMLRRLERADPDAAAFFEAVGDVRSSVRRLGGGRSTGHRSG
jgi:uncharacterized protein involved in exopolysaccharide biosynthesis